jgi:3-dehydroquinate dehydratase
MTTGSARFLRALALQRQNLNMLGTPEPVHYVIRPLADADMLVTARSARQSYGVDMLVTLIV